MENFPRPIHRPDPEELSRRQAFLSDTPPFKLLPHAEIETIAANLVEKIHQEGSTLFVQEETTMPHILILRTGRLDRIIEIDGEETVRQTLEPGGIYGGISLLFNNGISTSTVHAVEAASSYVLDRENFLRLCVKYSGFARHFAGIIDQGREKFRDPESSGDAQSEDTGLAGSFLWKTVGDVARAFPVAPSRTDIRRAAELLTASRRSAIIVLDDGSRPVGLVTDSDLRTKVIVEGRSPEAEVGSIMSSPLIQVDARLPVFEAVLTMMRHRVKHLAVYENSHIKGVVTERDLFLARADSPVLLVHVIQAATRIDELKDVYATLPDVISNLISNGVRASHLNAIITAITDAVLTRIIDMALHAKGPAPAAFAFLLFGSEGRKEQTLKTDQDNAIVFAEVAPEDEERVRKYFLDLGRRVCDGLNEIGQTYCEFEIMARNPAWCQPLSRWKAYYRKWIESDDPETLLNANIFFDFRLGYGQQELVDSLHAALFEKLSEWPGFLRHMARSALHYRPPLGFFGNFVLHEGREGEKGLDIKSAMRLVVDFGRIYAMQSNITETNTLKRLDFVYKQNRMDLEELDDVMHAYEFLMYQRLKHQSESMKKPGGRPDNFLRPSNLTTIDQQALKEAFKQIRTAHARMRLDFFLHFPS